MLKVLVTNVKNNLAHDVMNELYNKQYFSVGTDIEDEYSGIQDKSAVTLSPYARMNINSREDIESVLGKELPDIVICCHQTTGTDENSGMNSFVNFSEVCRSINCKLVYVTSEAVDYSAIWDKTVIVYIDENIGVHSRKVWAEKLIDISSSENYGIYKLQ